MDSEKTETLFGAGFLELSEFVSSWLLGYWAPSWRVRLGGRRLDSTMDDVDTDLLVFCFRLQVGGARRVGLQCV